MGESLVETPKVENKMGDSVANTPCLQESVSFGRFEHDSLCWERWSTFPTNKYLEEVEKCSTPGSVAQKKAYFEAHYKKIAARKAELEEEKKREAESMNLEDQFLMDSGCDASEEDMDVEKLSTQNSADGTELLNEVRTSTSEVTDKHIDILRNSAVVDENEVTNLNIEVTERIDELTDDTDVTDEVNEEADLISEVNENIDVLDDKADEAVEKKDIQLEYIDESLNNADKIKINTDTQLQLEDHDEDLHLNMEVPELPNEPVLVKEDTASARVWQDKEVLPQEKVDEREIAERETKSQVESVDVMKMNKTTTVKKTTSTTLAKKKPASPTPRRPAAPMSKSPIISTPKPSKPELIKTAKSTTRPAIKKDNGYTPLTSKKAARPRPESMRLTPTSLHMSLSYGPTNSDPTRRKSLIMESMGDKDIVKRAFKAFQNVSVSPSTLTQPTATNQSATKRAEPKVSAPDILQKKKEGIIRAAKTTSPSIGQHGVKKTPQSHGLKKTIGVDQRNGKAVPTYFGSRSLDQGRLQKEVSKKVEQNTNMKDARKTPFQSKLKAEKAAEIGKPSQRNNSKPKLSSSYNQGHGFLRGVVRKEDAKI